MTYLGPISREATGQNIAGSSFNEFYKHAIKRRQHSTERDVDLLVEIECKKMQILYDRSKQINTDLQNILKLLSSRQHEQRALTIPMKSLQVTPQMLVWRSSAYKCSMAVSDNEITIL